MAGPFHVGRNNASLPQIQYTFNPRLTGNHSETVALENPAAFFKFVDRITHPEINALSPSLSAEALHQLGLETAVASGLLPEPGALNIVEMNLAMHAATPKIEAFYQQYGRQAGSRGNPCGGGSWIDWYGATVCDVETLVQLAGKETIDSAENVP